MLPPEYNDPFGLNNVTRTVTIGFDDILRKLSSIGESQRFPSFPPYNIKKTGENSYVVEMAVAGFGKQDIELILEEDVLTVKGNISSSSEDDFIHKGIAERSFTRKFTLADTIKVKSSSLANGMLKIFLEKYIPEEKKARKIEILE